MLSTLRNRGVFPLDNNYRTLAIAGLVLLVAALAGWKASSLLLAGILGVAALAVVLERPSAGVALMVPAVMLVPTELLVSNYVRVNIAVLIVPALTGIWLLVMVRRRHLSIISSPANRPVLLFVLAATASLLLSRVDWDLFVPTPPNFIWIQLGQWSIYVFSMLAFLLSANLLTARSLAWTAQAYVVIGGIIAILWAIPPLVPVAQQITPPGLANSVYWVWLTAFAASFLLFGDKLRLWYRVFCIVSLAALWSLSLLQLQDWLSGQVPPATTLLMLFALRLRKKSVFLVVLLLATLALLGGFVYEFWGGDTELQVSGGGRLAHYQLVWRFASQKPLLGLGPGAYRHYVNTDPGRVAQLLYRSAPVSSHNNYLDLFANIGVIGVIAVVWLLTTIGRVGWRLRARLPDRGFEAVYTNAAIAGLAGTAVSGLLGDWFLPFVYNVGFPGFRSSVLVWVFLGGLIALWHSRMRDSGRDPSP